MGYLFVPPKSIDATDAKNIHIFKATKNEKGTINADIKACCEKVKRVIKDCGYLEYHEKIENSRNFAAKQENDKNETCGQCVATLYSDKDKNLKS